MKNTNSNVHIIVYKYAPCGGPPGQSRVRSPPSARMHTTHAAPGPISTAHFNQPTSRLYAPADRIDALSRPLRGQPNFVRLLDPTTL